MSYCSISKVKTDDDINLFSKCVNLKNLTLHHCQFKGLDGVSFCYSRLSNLTLVNVNCWGVINVVAPQLKNLTLVNINTDFQISAPLLASLIYKTCYFWSLLFSKDGLLFMEKAHLCI